MLDDPRYTLSQVADAAGVQVGTLRSWLQRKHWRLDVAVGDTPADIAGKAHLITLRRALHIGAATELVRNNVDPARAFQAARSFVDVFDWIPPGAISDGGVRGEDGLYPSGWTLLVAYPDSDAGVVMWADDKRPVSKTPLANLFFPQISAGRQVSGVFVWLNQVDRRIRTSLPGAND